MKFLNITFLLLICAAFFMVSCNNSSDSSSDTTATETPEAAPGNIQTDAINSQPVTNADGSAVQHYICPNKCEGSGGSSKGTCPACGTEYEHNPAFHVSNNSNAATPGRRAVPQTGAATAPTVTHAN